MTNQQEDKPSKSKGFFVGLLLFGLVEIGLLVTAFVYIFGEIFSPDMIDFSKYWTGFWYLGGFMVGLIIVLPILMIAFIMSKRKALTKTFHNITGSVTTSTAALAPYSASYRPTKKGNVFYCDYCGYEVRSNERECPECSGPIKRGKRVA